MSLLCSCCGDKVTAAQARYLDTPLGRRLVCGSCDAEMKAIYDAIADGDGDVVMEALEHDAVGTE